uniref:Protein kinase domain-containing protein n=1 Tax=Parastrongyloides trichosuri TaxID=131310 RepID=A0A0N4ZBG8_PARTI
MNNLLSPIVGSFGNYTIELLMTSRAGTLLYYGKDNQTDTPIVLKTVEKEYLEKTLKGYDYDEIKALIKLQLHQNILRLFQIVESDTHYNMITEYVPGRTLFDCIIQDGRYNENDARKLFQQLVAAVAHCHVVGIAHRDIKLENIMIDTTNTLRLIDFGLASTKLTNLTQPCGSLPYTAPEILAGHEYDGTKADIWSMGVCLFIMLVGKFPFENSGDRNKLLCDIFYRDLNIPFYISINANDILRKTLVRDPTNRHHVGWFLSHAWFRTDLNDAIRHQLEKYNVTHDYIVRMGMNNIIPSTGEELQDVGETKLQLINLEIDKIHNIEKAYKAKNYYDPFFALINILDYRCKYINKRQEYISLRPPSPNNRGSITTGLSVTAALAAQKAEKEKNIKKTELELEPVKIIEKLTIDNSPQETDNNIEVNCKYLDMRRHTLQSTDIIQQNLAKLQSLATELNHNDSFLKYKQVIPLNIIPCIKGAGIECNCTECFIFNNKNRKCRPLEKFQQGEMYCEPVILEGIELTKNGAIKKKTRQKTSGTCISSHNSYTRFPNTPYNRPGSLTPNGVHSPMRRNSVATDNGNSNSMYGLLSPNYKPFSKSKLYFQKQNGINEHCEEECHANIMSPNTLNTGDIMTKNVSEPVNQKYAIASTKIITVHNVSFSPQLTFNKLKNYFEKNNCEIFPKFNMDGFYVQIMIKVNHLMIDDKLTEEYPFAAWKVIVNLSELKQQTEVQWIGVLNECNANDYDVLMEKLVKDFIVGTFLNFS